MGLGGHYGTGTPWDWDTMGPGHNETGTHWDWDTMGLGHRRTAAGPLTVNVCDMSTEVCPGNVLFCRRWVLNVSTPVAHRDVCVRV